MQTGTETSTTNSLISLNIKDSFFFSFAKKYKRFRHRLKSKKHTLTL